MFDQFLRRQGYAVEETSLMDSCDLHRTSEGDQR